MKYLNAYYLSNLYIAHTYSSDDHDKYVQLSTDASTCETAKEKKEKLYNRVWFLYLVAR